MYAIGFCLLLICAFLAQANDLLSPLDHWILPAPNGDALSDHDALLGLIRIIDERRIRHCTAYGIYDDAEFQIAFIDVFKRLTLQMPLPSAPDAVHGILAHFLQPPLPVSGFRLALETIRDHDWPARSIPVEVAWVRQLAILARKDGAGPREYRRAIVSLAVAIALRMPPALLSFTTDAMDGSLLHALADALPFLMPMEAGVENDLVTILERVFPGRLSYFDSSSELLIDHFLRNRILNEKITDVLTTRMGIFVDISCRANSERLSPPIWVRLFRGYIIRTLNHVTNWMDLTHQLVSVNVERARFIVAIIIQVFVDAVGERQLLRYFYHPDIDRIQLEQRSAPKVCVDKLYQIVYMFNALFLRGRLQISHVIADLSDAQLLQLKRSLLKDWKSCDDNNRCKEFVKKILLMLVRRIEVSFDDLSQIPDLDQISPFPQIQPLATWLFDADRNIIPNWSNPSNFDQGSLAILQLLHLAKAVKHLSTSSGYYRNLVTFALRGAAQLSQIPEGIIKELVAIDYSRTTKDNQDDFLAILKKTQLAASEDNLLAVFLRSCRPLLADDIIPQKHPLLESFRLLVEKAPLEHLAEAMPICPKSIRQDIFPENVDFMPIDSPKEENWPESNESNCSICLQKLELDIDDEGVEELDEGACRHRFHKDCLDQWRHKESCPLCRENLSFKIPVWPSFTRAQLRSDGYFVLRHLPKHCPATSE